MMIAAVCLYVFDVTLHKRSAAEFATPNYQCVVKHPTGLEVFDQRSTRLIGVFALDRKLRR